MTPSFAYYIRIKGGRWFIYRQDDKPVDTCLMATESYQSAVKHALALANKSKGLYIGLIKENDNETHTGRMDN